MLGPPQKLRPIAQSGLSRIWANRQFPVKHVKQCLYWHLPNASSPTLPNNNHSISCLQVPNSNTTILFPSCLKRWDQVLGALQVSRDQELSSPIPGWGNIVEIRVVRNVWMDAFNSAADSSHNRRAPGRKSSHISRPQIPLHRISSRCR